jgi:hypothetical protein
MPSVDVDGFEFRAIMLILWIRLTSTSLVVEEVVVVAKNDGATVPTTFPHLRARADWISLSLCVCGSEVVQGTLVPEPTLFYLFSAWLRGSQSIDCYAPDRSAWKNINIG